MSIILFSLILIYVSYLILLVRFNYNFKKPPRVHPRTGNIVPISIIVAVKNGETSLPILIDCLKNQTYTGEVEYIIVDDQSTDNTHSIIAKIANEDNRFIFASSLDGEESLSFKKKALDSGIKLAKHEWLLFTDVDCRPPIFWVEEMAEFFTEKADYVIGMSKVIPDQSFLSIFQSIDFQMLMTATYAQSNMGHPWACTGQNQAYRKSIFNKVSGFKHLSSLLQGDDSVFMQLCKKSGAKIISAFTENLMIARTEKNWCNFLKQRMRWAGDSRYMIKLCPTFFIASLITFLANLLIIIIIFISPGNILIPLLILKLLAENSLYNGSNQTSIKTIEFEGMWFIWFILQIPYIIIVGSLSFWSHQLFGWRGKKT